MFGGRKIEFRGEGIEFGEEGVLEVVDVGVIGVSCFIIFEV